MFHAWPPQNRQKRKMPTEHTIDPRGVPSSNDFFVFREWPCSHKFTKAFEHDNRFEWNARTHKSFGKLVYPLSSKRGAWSYKYLPPSRVCLSVSVKCVCAFHHHFQLIWNWFGIYVSIFVLFCLLIYFADCISLDAHLEGANIFFPAHISRLLLFSCYGINVEASWYR